MKTLLLGSVAIVALSVGATAYAADLPLMVAPVWNWAGFYIGGHVGGGAGNANFSDPFGGSIYGDNVSTPVFLAGGQIGYNFQKDSWVFGLEGDASWASSDGTSTCLAVSGFYVSSNCHSNPGFFASVAGRVGYALGPLGRTLVYAKGGAAFIENRGDVTANNQSYGEVENPQFATHFDSTRVGWLVGVGVEQALTPAWSVKFEYNFMDFNGMSVATPASIFYPPPDLVVPANRTSVSNTAQVAKVGINYRFGIDPWARWDTPDAAPYAVEALPKASFATGWEVEAAPRVWFSSGKFQWNNSPAPLVGATVAQSVLVSRLTYAGMAGPAGELYSRVDSPWNIFVKGNVGLGGFSQGHMNDEDWSVKTKTPDYPLPTRIRCPAKGTGKSDMRPLMSAMMF